MKLEKLFAPRNASILFILALPAFLQSAYEMYWLTPKAGPQLLLFSSLNSLSVLIAGLWLISIAAFVMLGVFAAVSLILVRAGKLEFLNGYLRFLVNIPQITGVHLFLFLLYYEWANLLFVD